MLTLIGLVFLFVAVLLGALLVSYLKELMLNDHRPPVAGSTLTMLIHFNKFFDYVALIAKKHRTFRFITPTHSEVYIADPINVEHVLKSNFQNYTKDGKYSEKDDVLPDGFKIKKGDGISYMAYPMGRMTYIWGEDAEEFRPERWLHDGVFQPESPFKFTAFQGGPRICLGKEFAYRQMKIMAAFLVFFFKFRLVDESKEATYRTMFTLHMDNGLHLYASPRSKA
ncbi:hypothetical protein M8C21_026948 [Ambrosia artemisiifolia]|uniref:Uncharacterized protein n=1 Tax=Ambrosia artemisiifolia TaxID=4212 RepID=A0AAD5G3Y2_AMBAR|nr:hypothetical protein M8C21_026948 [Ambrosia artemisiifolia]